MLGESLPWRREVSSSSQPVVTSLEDFGLNAAFLPFVYLVITQHAFVMRQGTKAVHMV